MFLFSFLFFFISAIFLSLNKIKAHFDKGRNRKCSLFPEKKYEQKEKQRKKKTSSLLQKIAFVFQHIILPRALSKLNTHYYFVIFSTKQTYTYMKENTSTKNIYWFLTIIVPFLLNFLYFLGPVFNQFNFCIYDWKLPMSTACLFLSWNTCLLFVFSSFQSDTSLLVFPLIRNDGCWLVKMA